MKYQISNSPPSPRLRRTSKYQKHISKVLIFTLFLMPLFVLTSCAKQEEQKVKEVIKVGAGDPSIYLKVEAAKASSFDDTPDWAPRPDATAVVDRDMLTRWSSKLGLKNQWIYFDFGKTKVLSKIVIKWESAYAVDYEILASSDAKNWKRLVFMEGQDGGKDEIEFAPIKTQFVKIMSLKRNNPDWGFSMWEIELYGPKSLNPDEKEVKADVGNLEEKKKEFETALAKLKASPTPLTLDEFQKGVVLTSWSDSELNSIASDLMFVHLHKIGVRDIAIMIPTYQEFIDSDTIVKHDYEGGDTPRDEAIIHAIKTAHSLGMKVMLKPHVDCMDGTPRIDILGSEKWFANYKEMVLHYAKMATDYNVESFSVGTELENTTFERWDKEWRDVINSIKGVYKGHLNYAANWTEFEEVPFWDMMDFVGIDAYFPLTGVNNPTPEELISGWEKIADKIEKWLIERNINKPVIFTELGYSSSDGTNKTPWATLKNAEDQKEQAACLEAAFQVLTKRTWFKGIYLWQYFPQDRWSPLGFTVKEKEAEKVLSEWYSKL